MCKKLIYLVSFVLVLGLVGTSLAGEVDPSLVGWWKFDDGSGTTAIDSSGNGFDIALQNTTWENGLFGGAVHFRVDGSGTGSLTFSGNAITLCAWVWHDAFITGQVERYVTISEQVFLRKDANGTLQFIIMTDGTHRFMSVADVLTEGRWHHVAGTWDGLTQRLYCDGVEIASQEPGGVLGTITDVLLSNSHPAEPFNGMLDDARIYNRALTSLDIMMLMDPTAAAKAFESVPADRATDVPRDDVVLSWMPGDYADKHDVYFETSFDDVNDASPTEDPAGVYLGRQDPNTLALDRLELGQTYYWRVDEVNAAPDYTIFKGDVWSFAVEPIAYTLAGEHITATASSLNIEGEEPANTINGSGLNSDDLHSTETTDMWLSSAAEPNAVWIQYEFDKAYKLHQMLVWNHNSSLEPLVGFGVKDVAIEYSVNGTDYTTLAGVPEFAQAPGTPDYAHNTTIDFSGVAAKYVRLTANSNWGGIFDQYGLSEVRFFSIPVFAREPNPDSGTTDVAVDVTLGFRAGREADTHDVYLSSDEQAVIDGNAPVTTVTEASFGPLSLDLGETYYWKINEVNMAETPTTWQGEIWNFTTHEFFVVDDFEDYNDYPPDEIWSTWVDGYGVPENGATVGYPAPDWNQDEHYVETTNVHGGEQAMPFFYDNTGAATYSEGERTFAVPQDWTAAGVQTLALYFRGSPGNTGQLYAKVNGSKVVYDGDASNLARAGWQAWNIELASFGTNLQNVTTLGIGINSNGTSGTLYFDDIRLYPYSRQFITPVEPNTAGLVGQWKLDEGSGDTAIDSSGNGFDIPLQNTTWENGVSGGAVHFLGEGEGRIGDFNYSNNAITVCAWVWHDAFRTGQVERYVTVDPEVVVIRKEGDGRVRFYIKTDGQLRFLWGSNVTEGQWYHVAGTWDGLTQHLYIDGVEIASQAPGGVLGNSSGVILSSAGEPLNGMLDDVRIYERMLSQEEIGWLAGRTLPFDKPF